MSTRSLITLQRRKKSSPALLKKLDTNNFIKSLNVITEGSMTSYVCNEIDFDKQIGTQIDINLWSNGVKTKPISNIHESTGQQL